MEQSLLFTEVLVTQERYQVHLVLI